MMPARKSTISIFISHQWAAPSDYERIAQFLNEQKLFRWRNVSVDREHSLKGPYRVKLIMDHIALRMRLATVVILASAGVYSGNRLWYEREVILARESFANPKPLIVIKPYHAKYWNRMITDHADAWALFKRDSIVNGIVALSQLTPSFRSALKRKYSCCQKCASHNISLELNRLKGGYCRECGTVVFTLDGESSNRWLDRNKVFPRYDEGKFAPPKMSYWKPRSN